MLPCLLLGLAEKGLEGGQLGVAHRHQPVGGQYEIDHRGLRLMLTEAADHRGGQVQGLVGLIESR